MIIATGIDIVEVANLRECIESNDQFKKSFFSQDEIQFCEKQLSPYHAFAVHIAIKEAFFKALHASIRAKKSFTEVSVKSDQWSSASLRFSGEVAQKVKALGDFQLHISSSHTNTYVTAMVIIEKQAQVK